jgi:flagellar motor switch protein FliN/FliY
MPGESDSISQDDIEELLRKAQAAAGTAVEPPRETAASPAPAAPPRQVTDDVSFLLNQAEAALASVDQPAEPDLAGLAPFEFRDFGGAPASGEKATLALLSDVELDVKIELGRSEMHLEDVLRLKRGSVVTLDKLAGDPVDIYVNGRLIARGEVLVLNDNFCVRVAELLTGEETKAA